MIHILLICVACVALGILVRDFLDGRNLLLEIYDRLRLRSRTLEEWDRRARLSKAQSNVVICLTSIPQRLPFLEGPLKSLLAQTNPAGRIRIHLPTTSMEAGGSVSVPAFLNELNSVEIVPCNDTGPSTKLLPALSDCNPDQKLLIVDDDMIYPPNLVESLERLSDENPDLAIASSGWIVPDDFVCRFITLRSNLLREPPMPHKATRVREAVEVDILQGYSGYLVKPRFFDLDEITDYTDAPEAARYVDDVWISAHCRARKFVFPQSRFCFHPWKKQRLYRATSLRRFNRGGGDPEKRNNTLLARHFGDRWLLQREGGTS